MKRRHFLAMSTVSIPVAAKALDVEEAWWDRVESVSDFTAKSDEGKLTLSVGLEFPKEADLVELPEENGEYRGYSYKGEKLPMRFWPGCSLITKFEFRWDGKSISVERRFWRDLAGFTIQNVPNKPALKPEDSWKYDEFIGRLNRPRVMLSADGGTGLIEWVRSEECDSSSTIRWIISRSGTVLRHRYEPPHEC